MRTDYCGNITEEYLGQKVKLYGWVNTRRDHGGVVFLDLRDRYGLVQLVIRPEETEAFAIADKIRNEYVIGIEGTVCNRLEGTVNENLKTGKIEVEVNKLDLINKSATLPFQLDEHHKTSEEVRLKYRFLDLRRDEMQKRFELRAKVIKFFRNYLDDHKFLDVETPYLTKPTPEGARDYLIPSRTHHGNFFALPQSPQILKQILMMSGFDRYYQIVRCFRDEDLRADRQPEFTQLDIETSFMGRDEIMSFIEKMIRGVFKEFLDVDFDSVPVLEYKNVMRDYGVDRPDLRNPLKLIDIADLLKDVEFKVFNSPANDSHGRVCVLNVPGGSKLTRKEIDAYTKFVSIYKAKGLAYIKVNELEKGIEGLQSPILKFLPDNVVTKILERANAKNGDLLFFGADKSVVVNEAMGALRCKVGEDLNLLEGKWKPVWVVDFPLFEREKATNKLYAVHHPFTASKENVEIVKNDPENCTALAYDLVLNGSEIGGGSVRIHDLEMQKAVFEALGISAKEAELKFGHLLKAMQYGCPIHGGIAFGIDRIIMLMAGVDSIRDVIAFPKTQTASCPLTEAPSEIDFGQLYELGVQVVKKENE
tara:strand:- start:1830 stop:3602 length:1773 start_codon:yes stop_codon:yes gene_type:complete